MAKKDKDDKKDDEEKEDKSSKKEKGEGEDAAEGEEGGEKKGLKALLANKKKLVIVAAAVLLLGGGGAAFFFLKKSPAEGEEEPAKEESTETTKEGEHKTEEKKEEGHGEKKEDGHGGEKGKEGEAAAPIPGAPAYYNLPEILVNLNTSANKQTTLLKVAVTLELAKPEDSQLIDANLPRIQDSFNTYLREMRASDLAGSAGVYRLREELLLRINKIISPAKVNDVLFKNILVQ